MISEDLFTIGEYQISGTPLPKLSAAPRKVHLRPYQTECLQRVEAAFDRGLRRGLVVMATGLGKTTLFSEQIRRAVAKGRKVLVIAHQIELLDQAADRIRSMCPGVRVGIQGGEHKASISSQVIVAGNQSLGREKDPIPWFKPSLVVVDECHHAAADSYMIIFRRYGCFEDGGAELVGVTATPHRLDNKPLHGTEKAIFQEVLYDMALARAIREGWLCDLRAYRVAASMDLNGIKKTGGDFNQKQLQERVNNDADNELAFNSWKKEASDRRTIVFCAGVDHAEEMAEVFRSNGVTAKSIHGRMDTDVRERAMADFRSGKIQVLTNMQLVTEGVDVPEASCVLLMRPTQSWSLYTQMVGRGVRTTPEALEGLNDATPEERQAAIAASAKPDCVVIDVVGVTSNLSLASVPAILGMPITDMEGQSAKEAMRVLDGLDEGVRAALFRRPTTFRGLTADLTKVDLLAELAVPEEAAKATLYAWAKVGEGEYILACGSDDKESKRQASLKSDTLGAWKLRLHSDKRDETQALEAEEVADAFREADELIRAAYPGVGAVANARAKWRKDPPTEKQVALLRKFRIEEVVIATLTKGDASQLLDREFQKRGPRR